MAKRTVTTEAAAGVDAKLLEEFKDFKGIAVLERRLQDPDLPGSVAIRLNDEPSYLTDPHGKKRTWYVRWINASEAGRFSQITDVMGYVPVRVDELQNPEGVMAGLESKDGIVRRGDRGGEVLVKMPLKLYNMIKQRQQDVRQRRSRNAKLVREDLANAAGNAIGSEAGDTIHDEFSVEIKRGKRTTIGDELGAD